MHEHCQLNGCKPEASNRGNADNDMYSILNISCSHPLRHLHKQSRSQWLLMAITASRKTRNPPGSQRPPKSRPITVQVHRLPGHRPASSHRIGLSVYSFREILSQSPNPVSSGIYRKLKGLSITIYGISFMKIRVRVKVSGF